MVGSGRATSSSLNPAAASSPNDIPAAEGLSSAARQEIVDEGAPTIGSPGRPLCVACRKTPLNEGVAELPGAGLDSSCGTVLACQSLIVLDRRPRLGPALRVHNPAAEPVERGRH